MLASVYSWLVHGDGYQITSGPLALTAIVAAIGGLYWHHTCHQPGCARLVRHGHTRCSHHATTP